MEQENRRNQQTKQVAKGRIWEWRVIAEGTGEEFQGEPAVSTEDNEEVEIGMMVNGMYSYCIINLIKFVIIIITN